MIQNGSLVNKYIGAIGIAIAAGIIIAQRRPMKSAVHPQNDMPRKLRMLATMNGTAVPIVVSLRSACRCVANNAQIE